MVVIYTNESNPATLKLLICSNLAAKTVEIKSVTTHGKLDILDIIVRVAR